MSIKIHFILIACIIALVGAQEGESEYDPSQEYLQAATTFCNSTLKPTQCAFVEDIGGPELNVTNSVCVYCGTIWTGWYNPDVMAYQNPPLNIEGHPSYYQYLGKILSLGCTGNITVSAIFKYLNGDGCFMLAGETLAFNVSETTRCEVVLPDDAVSDEDAAVLDADVVNCVTCGICEKTCPQEPGVWYKDIISFAIPDECPPTSWPQVPEMIIDPQVSVRLASYKIE